MDEFVANSAGQVKAEETVNLNVTAPGGTKVSSSTNGIFQSTRTRYRQMQDGADGGAATFTAVSANRSDVSSNQFPARYRITANTQITVSAVTEIDNRTLIIKASRTI